MNEPARIAAFLLTAATMTRVFSACTEPPQVTEGLTCKTVSTGGQLSS